MINKILGDALSFAVDDEEELVKCGCGCGCGDDGGSGYAAGLKAGTSDGTNQKNA